MTETDVFVHGLFRYPISTAPRDGTEVLLFQLDDVDFGVWEWFAPEDGWEGGFGWTSNRGFIEEPDFWCPVPKPVDAVGDASCRVLRDHNYCIVCCREVHGDACRPGHRVVRKPAEYAYVPVAVLQALQEATAALDAPAPAEAVARLRKALATVPPRYLEGLHQKTEAKFQK